MTATEPKHLSLEQTLTRALALHDARVRLFRQGWDVESVLRLKWTVQFEPDGSCTVKQVASEPRQLPQLGLANVRDAGKSTFTCRRAVGGLKVAVHVSRKDLAQLVAGTELVVGAPLDAGGDSKVEEVRVSAMLE